LLGKAIALTKDSDKRKALERSLFKLRHLYIDTCNKGNGLRGKQLKAFSHTLAEVLKFCIKNKVKRLKFNTSYRKYLRSVALVDIGDYEPWYKSPVVKKIIANPEETVGKELKAGNLVPDGIQFITMNLPGGELITDYKAETVRPFIRVLRRASSPNSELRIPFELKNAPEKGATLVVEGLDCEKPERNANMAIRINGIFVAHHKPNKFKKDEWSKVRFKIKPGILKKGINTLRIYNTTMEKADEVYTEVAGVDMANYYWGWFAISDIKLHLPKK
jgi:hypothetical protein